MWRRPCRHIIFALTGNCFLTSVLAADKTHHSIVDIYQNPNIISYGYISKTTKGATHSPRRLKETYIQTKEEIACQVETEEGQ